MNNDFLSLVFVFIVIILYKFISNLMKKSRFEKLTEKYYSYMKSVSEKKELNDFIQYIEEFKKLLINAGQNSYQIPDTQNIGNGYISTLPIDIFDNMTFNNQYIFSSMMLLIQRAIGVYKKRMRDAFNLLYWIECIIYLPSHIIKYCGGEKDGSLSKFFNVIYWLVNFFTIVFSIGNSNLLVFLKHFFINL